jgi:hypothetical protein
MTSRTLHANNTNENMLSHLGLMLRQCQCLDYDAAPIYSLGYKLRSGQFSGALRVLMLRSFRYRASRTGQQAQDKAVDGGKRIGCPQWRKKLLSTSEGEKI